MSNCSISNYKWVKMGNEYVELRKEDFSSFPTFEVKNIDPILRKKLDENGIDYWLDGDGFLEPCRYVLNAIDRKLITITAPLYKYDLGINEFVLLSDSYTDKAIDPAEYEWVKENYGRCVEEVASEQAKIFDKLFVKNSSDGISSVVTISSDPYEYPNDFCKSYIPEGYIKVCTRRFSFTFNYPRYEVVFIKKMDAKGQVVNIKVAESYKGLVIGKGGKNIKRVEELINARLHVI